MIFKKSLLLIFVLSTALAAQQIPYTILISFDGFRYDYPDRNLTPNLKTLEENGVRALSLKPCFPSKTFPNHLSIVTGLYPENHGIISNIFIDPVSKDTFSVYDSAAVRNAKWYRGEAIWETAERQGVKTGSYFWPGSEVNLNYRRSTYVEKYEHKRNNHKRIDDILKWLSLPYSERPKLVSLYFDASDTYGHRYGPQSRVVDLTIMHLDSLIGRLLIGLGKNGISDSVNLIVVSDHGMTELSMDKVVNVSNILRNFKFNYSDIGPFMFIKPSEDNADKVFDELKRNEGKYKVYHKSDIPGYLNYSNNYLIPDIILIAEPGWSLFTDKDFKKVDNLNYLGNHGYDPNFIDMHGIFIAAGPSFKQNFKTGTIRNIDIYPLLAKILKVVPNRKIDGNLENIEFLLKEN